MNNQMKISITGIFLLFLTLIAITFVTSCKEDSYDVMKLYNSVWIFPRGESEDISISFESTRDGFVDFKGYSGINYFSGSYKIKGRKLKLASDIAMTKMAGSVEAMKNETEFIQFLSSTVSFSFIEGDRRALMLHGKDKTIYGIEFSLVNKSYEIYDANDFESDSLNVPYISFSKDNLASVYTGVNYVEGVYVFIPESSSFEFVSGLTTLALGSDEENVREERILNLLSKCEKFNLKGNEINLLDENENIVLTLLRKVTQ